MGLILIYLHSYPEISNSPPPLLKNFKIFIFQIFCIPTLMYIVCYSLLHQPMLFHTVYTSLSRTLAYSPFSCFGIFTPSPPYKCSVLFLPFRSFLPSPFSKTSCKLTPLIHVFFHLLDQYLLRHFSYSTENIYYLSQLFFYWSQLLYLTDLQFPLCKSECFVYASSHRFFG